MVDVVLGTFNHYLSNSENDSLQRSAGYESLRDFAELLGKNLKDKFGFDVRIDEGRYRRGSHIFEFMGIAFPAAAIAAFLREYPNISKGIHVLVSDIQKVVIFTATTFSVQRQETLDRVSVKPQSQRKIKKAISTRKKAESDQERKRLKDKSDS